MGRAPLWVGAVALLVASGAAASAASPSTAPDPSVCVVNVPSGMPAANNTVTLVRIMLKHCAAGQKLEATDMPYNPAVPQAAGYWQSWMCAQPVPGKPVKFPVKEGTPHDGIVGFTCEVNPSETGR